MSSVQIQNYVNTPQTETNQSSLSRTVLGIAGGAASGWASSLVLGGLIVPYVDKFNKEINKFSLEEQKELLDVSREMIEKSGIGNKKNGFNGLVLIDPAKEDSFLDSISQENKFYKDFAENELFQNLEKFTNNINRNTNKNANNFISVSNDIEKVSLEKANEIMAKGIIEAYEKGSFADKLKISFVKITNPFRKISEILYGLFKRNKADLRMGLFEAVSNRVYTGNLGSLTHEVQHAINKNGNFLTKLPLNLAMISVGLLMPLVIFNAMFTKKPQKPDETTKDERSLFKKIRDFTHNHVGLTIASLWLPTIVEEAQASLKAVKEINKSKIISESTKMQHNKVLGLAFGTYLIMPAIFASMAKIAVFVKDEIVKHKSED